MKKLAPLWEYFRNAWLDVAHPFEGERAFQRGFKAAQQDMHRLTFAECERQWRTCHAPSLDSYDLGYFAALLEEKERRAHYAKAKG